MRPRLASDWINPSFATSTFRLPGGYFLMLRDSCCYRSRGFRRYTQRDTDSCFPQTALIYAKVFQILDFCFPQMSLIRAEDSEFEFEILNLEYRILN